MATRSSGRTGRVAAVAAMAGLATSAWGQTIDWNAPAGGAWGAFANWSPQNVPDTTTETAVLGGSSAYTVSLGSAPAISPNILALNISNPLAVLDIDAGRSMVLNSSSTNNGLVRINPTIVGAVTFIRVDSSATLSGTGEIRLVTNGANSQLNTTGGAVLTNGAGHTIRGIGQLNAQLVNDGSVLADDSVAQNGFPLLLQGSPKTNNATMGAAPGSELRLSGITLTQSVAGSLTAAGPDGVVSLTSATIVGGGFTGTGGGSLSTFSGTSTLQGVTLNGPMDVNVSTGVIVTGTGLTNNGLLRINPTQTGGSTTLTFNTTGTLDGTGEVRLVTNGANSQLNTGVGVTMTQAAGHTIRGTGQVNANLVNNGLILADDSVGQNNFPLVLQSSPKVNNAIMRADAGSELSALTVTINQSPTATIEATGAGAVFRTAGTTVVGGSFLGTGGGQWTVSTGATTLTSVTLNGPVDVSTSTSITVNGLGLTNNGLLRVNPQQTGGVTSVTFGTSGTLGGTGELRLVTNGANSQLNTAANQTITHAAGHTIRGTGQVNATLDNHGLIQADQSVGQAGFPLVIQSNPKSNASVMEAAASSTLRVQNVTVTQTPGGVIRGATASSVVELSAATIVGGTVGSGAGIMRAVASANTFESVTLAMPAEISTSASLIVRGTGLVNNALLRVNPAGAGGVTTLRFDESGALGGSGTVDLATTSSNSRLSGLAGVSVIQESAHSTIGIGEINFPGSLTNRGRIAPGAAGDSNAGTIAVTGSFINEGTGVLDFGLGGTSTSQFDRLTGSAQYTLGGTLDLTLINAYVPVRQHTMRIIAGGSITDRFDTVIRPTLPAGIALRVVYLPTAVDVWFHCPPDLTTGAVPGVAGYGVPNGVLNNDDFFFYLNLFSSGDPDADLTTGAVPGQPGYGTPNGTINNDDFFFYLGLFAGGCS